MWFKITSITLIDSWSMSNKKKKKNGKNWFSFCVYKFLNLIAPIVGKRRFIFLTVFSTC